VALAQPGAVAVRGAAGVAGRHLALFGWVALPVFLGCWLFPRLFLAFVDYLEHYGLGRRRLADGTYEPIRAEHAWDDNYISAA